MSTLKFNRWQSTDGVTRNSVLQVVAKHNYGLANTASFTTSATYSDMLNMTATITPTSATSKILVTSVGSGLMIGTDTNSRFRLLANGVQVWGATRWVYKSGTHWSPVNWSSTTLHDPATTNPVTYTFQFAVSGGTSPQTRIGDAVGATDSYTAVFLMEIAQ